jgi:hypothetical protein
MDVRPAKVEGKVERRVVARGSKSERRAVVLTTSAGETFVLRRKGGPALGDRDLDSLVGHSIAAEGVATSGTLIMNRWRTTD